jgi:hypothetical protein
MGRITWSWGAVAIGLLASATALARGGGSSQALSSCFGFPTHAEVGDALDGFEASYPELARTFSLGLSVEGRVIWGLLVSADPDAESAEPEILVVGATHGNECLTVPTVLDLIEWLLDGYGDDSVATDLVDGAEIVFVPLLNPDGYARPIADRENANGVDLNRNYGFGWRDPHGGTDPFTEPETRALRTLVEGSSFTVGLSYHTIADFLSGPWNYHPHNLPADEDLFAAMGQAYAGDSGYIVTPGYDSWAGPTSGDQNDWLLGTRGTLDWTIELRSDTEPETDLHRAGFVAFARFAFTGVTGTVADADTGWPLEARIEFAPEGVPFFTDAELGDFHRPLLPGTYELTVFSQGYEPSTISDVEVLEGEATDLELVLEPAAPGTAAAAFAVNEMTIPFRIPSDTAAYENETRAWHALGRSDGRFYSISDDGSITVDMGETTPVLDVEGADLEVVSGTGSDDPVEVLVADTQDGPFVAVATGVGDLEIDLAGSGFDAVRYVRVASVGGGSGIDFVGPEPGYDLDAVVNLSVGVGDADADAGVDAGADASAGLDGSDDPSCGCSQVGAGAASPFGTLLQMLQVAITTLDGGK